MRHFYYQALNVDQQRVAGKIEADTVQQAIALLEAEGLTVQSIGYAAPESASGNSAPAGANAGGTTDAAASAAMQGGAGIEHAALRTHLTRVLEQAQAITPALRAYADEMPAGRRRRQLHTVCRVLDRGDVAEATSTLEKLPEYWIPLLSSATSSRDPGRVLHEFLAESQRADEIRRQWWLTLAYPVMVGCVAAAVLTALSFLVIPIFREIFQEFDLQLPELTLIVLTVSHWITSGGVVIIAAIIAVLGLLLLNARRWLPSSVGAWFNLPFGRATSTARFAQFTADLLEAGLDVPNALRIAGFTTRRPRLRGAAWRLANDLESRRDPAQSIRRHPLTATILHALRCDMAAASRIRLLREISDCYAGRARLRLSWTHGIIEPITIGVVGVFVGATVVALFLPLVKLIEGLSG
jgi:type IV pilus assembly protein PilC